MAVIALVAARLGLLLGSSVQPDALPMTLIPDRSADLYRGSALEVNKECRSDRRRFQLYVGEQEEMDREIALEIEERRVLRRRKRHDRRDRAVRWKETVRRGMQTIFGPIAAPLSIPDLETVTGPAQTGAVRDKTEEKIEEKG